MPKSPNAKLNAVNAVLNKKNQYPRQHNLDTSRFLEVSILKKAFATRKPPNKKKTHSVKAKEHHHALQLIKMEVQVVYHQHNAFKLAFNSLSHKQDLHQSQPPQLAPPNQAQAAAPVSETRIKIEALAINCDDNIYFQ